MGDLRDFLICAPGDGAAEPAEESRESALNDGAVTVHTRGMVLNTLNHLMDFRAIFGCSVKNPLR
ncbi:MAG: hypothetical protein IKD72_05450, partial [Clostridia bacterium]|nr:hypothetical protein [Clostridia bacterium]